jgi:23S rRNA (cytidine1920-2'-O)/16S rRNA (cytidine1409-2'-O)-methyltransferase
VESVNARTLSASDLIAAYADSTGANGQFDLEEDGETFDDFDDAGGDGSGDCGDAEAALADLPPEFTPPFDLLVADLSFISQTLVLPAAVPLLKDGGTLLTLVKPQFELQPGQVGKGGIVKDPAMYAIVEQRLREACAELDLTVTAWFDSPIEGGDGNREFFICARKAG